MKTILKALLIAAATIGNCAPAAQAADTPQKHEMRSAWVATVWRLDWPSTTISKTGNTTQINKQKQDMTRLLDSLSVNNLNAINFQVRSRCDVMYKSSYEPWSSDLVSERGLDPGYDPLEFVVDECHKRGMECHAWLNPYRYESVVGQWNDLPGCYRTDHPDWIIDVNNASILNPGKPEVVQRICDIIAEIVRNYDIDGVLFDDYFYLSGTPASADADLYNAYKADGGTLSQNDWRRENVNKMIAAVYKTIKDIKPYVRFGVSPAGIACTSSSVARSYGISPCPTGSDWQYNSIFSDPIAWISNQSLDFISPQIYWTIGNSTDYDKATKWWSEIAHKWNRHFYSSHSISSLSAQSKAPGMSDIELDLAQPLASGPNSSTFSEFANEVRLNRQYNQDDAPGSIFYSCKYLYSTAPLFAHYLRTTVFNTPALIPAMTWFPVSDPGKVTNVSRAGNKLSWTGRNNVRYTVYAVPSNIPTQNFGREVEYLLGVTYDTQYTLPDSYLTGYNFAVCVYDRYGNEYSPVFVGATQGKLAAPTLTAPTNGQSIEMPFDFKWTAVDNATNYIIEIADNADMSNLLYVKGVNATECSSTDFYNMPIDKPLYWRVRACGNNYNDGISTIGTFTPSNLEFTSPANDATDVALCPTLTWTFPDRKVELQIATADTFDDESIIYTTVTTGGRTTLPKYILSYATSYYARLLYQRNGVDCVTETLTFTTGEGTPDTPQIATPSALGTLYANEYITATPVEGIYSLRFEVCTTTKFPPRSSYIATSQDISGGKAPKTADKIRIQSDYLTNGETYWVRVCGQYRTADGSLYTEYSTPVQFVYSSGQNSIDDITADPADSKNGDKYTIDGRRITNPTPGTLYIDTNNRKVNIAR